MDTYLEQIVAIRKSPKERFIQVGTIVLGIVLILTCGLFYVANVLGMFSILFVAIGVGIGYGMYHMATQLNIEYEYIFTNGDLDVDKIISKRSRKRVLSTQCRFVSEFGQYHPDSFAGRTFDDRIVACTVDENAYYAIFNVTDSGETLLVFSPESRVLNAMKKYAPRVIKIDTTGN